MQKNVKINASDNDHLLIELKIPQLGEGLKEVCIIKLLKQSGDLIKEDEVIYEIETEKSLVEVESPYSGYLRKWLVQEGDILEVGTSLAIIELLELINFPQYEQHSSTELPLVSDVTTISEILSANNCDKQKLNIRTIPPRVRAYCKKLNLSEEIVLSIPYVGKKLTIEEVDKFLAS